VAPTSSPNSRRNSAEYDEQEHDPGIEDEAERGDEPGPFPAGPAHGPEDGAAQDRDCSGAPRRRLTPRTPARTAATDNTSSSGYRSSRSTRMLHSPVQSQRRFMPYS
jgi:hypothetical protein